MECLGLTSIARPSILASLHSPSSSTLCDPLTVLKLHRSVLGILVCFQVAQVALHSARICIGPKRHVYLRGLAEAFSSSSNTQVGYVALIHPNSGKIRNTYLHGQGSHQDLPRSAGT
jgi:hypothetical protein